MLSQKAQEGQLPSIISSTHMSLTASGISLRNHLSKGTDAFAEGIRKTDNPGQADL